MRAKNNHFCNFGSERRTDDALLTTACEVDGRFVAGELSGSFFALKLESQRSNAQSCCSVKKTTKLIQYSFLCLWFHFGSKVESVDFLATPISLESALIQES